MTVQETTPESGSIAPADQFDKLMMDEAYLEVRQESLDRRFRAEEMTFAQYTKESEVLEFMRAYHERERRHFVERADDSHKQPSLSKKIGRAVRDALFV